jgi:hypothetical protein
LRTFFSGSEDTVVGTRAIGLLFHEDRGTCRETRRRNYDDQKIRSSGEYKMPTVGRQRTVHQKSPGYEALFYPEPYGETLKEKGQFLGKLSIGFMKP